jgi:hypothetical protein
VEADAAATRDEPANGISLSAKTARGLTHPEGSIVFAFRTIRRCDDVAKPLGKLSLQPSLMPLERDAGRRQPFSEPGVARPLSRAEGGERLWQEATKALEPDRRPQPSRRSVCTILLPFRRTNRARRRHLLAFGHLLLNQGQAALPHFN